jgi:hypothetical protein
MNEKEIKAEMRLYVMEYLVASLFAMKCLENGPGRAREAFAQAQKQMTEGARQQTFSHLSDPALSDLYAAELEAAALRLSIMAGEQIDVVLRNLRK